MYKFQVNLKATGLRFIVFYAEVYNVERGVTLSH